jgi:dihydrolipoamide dehydrogenase
VIGQNKGLISLWFDRSSDQITGAELFGPQIEHLAHLVAWAVQSELTAERMLELPFYHPVLEESLRTALRRAVKALDAEDECQPSVFTECPGA